jgi:hypothetical protein
MTAGSSLSLNQVYSSTTVIPWWVRVSGRVAAAGGFGSVVTTAG